MGVGDELIKIGNNEFCPYLISQNVLNAVADTLKEDASIREIFKDNIVPYNKNDWSLQELPSLSIYTDTANVTSRNSLEIGDVTINTYFPMSMSRKPAIVMFVTVMRYISNILQSPTAFYSITDKLIPLPDIQANNYQSVVDYKESGLSPLIEIFRQFRLTHPKEVKDTWKGEIKSSYTIDMQNWMWFLENVGIDYTDPNKIIYPLIDMWKLYTNLE